MEEKVVNLNDFNEKKKDIEIIRNKLKELRRNGITDSFELEMKMMEEVPEQYSSYPWLIKRLTKSEDETILNKFLESLERVVLGEQTLAATELNLGLELKKQFLDSILEENKNKK
jgi:hypothetical protein